jgi:hypothetical protein
MWERDAFLLRLAASNNYLRCTCAAHPMLDAFMPFTFTHSMVTRKDGCLGGVSVLVMVGCLYRLYQRQISTCLDLLQLISCAGCALQFISYAFHVKL